MTAEHKYEMTISLQIVEHLGLNLYSNTSAVISEAVANAWDADAKTVEITLEKDCITIKDDGCGMDTDDINNKYLTVGYQKRHLVPITPMLNRKVMGRKGIGKLCLSYQRHREKQYTCYTLCRNSPPVEAGQTLETPQMTCSIKYKFCLHIFVNYQQELIFIVK